MPAPISFGFVDLVVRQGELWGSPAALVITAESSQSVGR